MTATPARCCASPSWIPASTWITPISPTVIAATADFTGQGPSDGNGHGTHCAAIAAGSGAASNGTYRGVAPEALLYTAKVLRNDGQGMMSDVMAGIEWATEQGVQVISLSLGGSGSCDGTDALCEMCDAAVEAGIVVCVAAGNDGPRSYTVGSPGCARQVITIGPPTIATWWPRSRRAAPPPTSAPSPTSCSPA